MLRLDEEQDIEVLRQVAQLLEQEVVEYRKIIAKLKKQLRDATGGEPEQLQLQIAELEQQLAKRNQMLFGDKSEKRPKATKPGEPAEPQRGHGPRPQPELPELEQVHLLDVGDRTCAKCGGELVVFDGQFEESEEVDVVERQFVVKKHRRQKYRCNCGECIETAPGPVKLFPGARYSVDFAVGVAIAKYADHLPLERQVKIMQREGLAIDSQTLWDQQAALGSLLVPSYNAAYEHVLDQRVIGADETWWRLMANKKKGSNKRWQVWTLAAPNAVYYELADSRSSAAAKALLEGYEGTVVCDGYAAYERVAKQQPGLKLAHCWAHARRKFVEAEESFPEACRQVLDLIGELYEVERRCPTGPPGDELRRRLRHEESRAIVKRIERWALEQRALPQSALGKAIAYMGGIWDGLCRFLDDPAIPVDNNATERALRGVVVGRKNHYGSKSKRGTDVAAIFYTLIESAKLCGVGPHTYLRAAAFAALRSDRALLPHEMA